MALRKSEAIPARPKLSNRNDLGIDSEMILIELAFLCDTLIRLGGALDPVLHFSVLRRQQLYNMEGPCRAEANHDIRGVMNRLSNLVFMH